MTIIEINQGKKIPYVVEGNKICFDDDLTINLAKRQEDWDVHIDICTDSDGALVIGTSNSNYYVAQINIPARKYIEKQNHAEAMETKTTEFSEQNQTQRDPVPFDINDVTLTLWALENYIV